MHWDTEGGAIQILPSQETAFLNINHSLVAHTFKQELEKRLWHSLQEKAHWWNMWTSRKWKLLLAPIEYHDIKVARNCNINLLSHLSQKENQLDFINLCSCSLTPHFPLRAVSHSQLTMCVNGLGEGQIASPLPCHACQLKLQDLLWIPLQVW